MKEKYYINVQVEVACGSYNGIPFTFEINNAEKKYKHVLKPFSAYTKKYNNGITINYTLDNYVKVYDPENNIAKQGYVTNRVDIGANINDIKYTTDDPSVGDIEIKPEDFPSSEPCRK